MAYPKQAERVQIDYFPLEGGENLVDAAINIAKGQLRFSANYEPADTRGYRRIDGYERFDGRPAPSEATILAIPFADGSEEPTIGQLVFGAASQSRGVVVGYTLISGSWVGGDASGFIALTTPRGDFLVGESLVDSVSGFTNGFDTGFG